MVNVFQKIIKFIKPIKKNDNVANFINSIVTDLSSIIRLYENTKDFKTIILPQLVIFFNKYKHRDKKTVSDMGSNQRKLILNEVYFELENLRQNHLNLNILNQNTYIGHFLNTLKISFNKFRLIQKKISNIENNL